MKQICILVVMLMMTGCVSSNYQSFNRGYGYQSEQQDDNAYYVTYTGSGKTEIEKINDFALLRSAEITLEKGYKYFVITEAKNNKIELEVNRPSLASFRDFGNGAATSPGTLSAPKAKSELTIMLFNEKPDEIHYEAERLVRAIKDEYEISDPA